MLPPFTPADRRPCPYSDQMGNKASYIHLRGSDLRPQFHQFTAVVSGGLGGGAGRGLPEHPGRSLMLVPLSPLLPQPHPNVKPMAYANALLQLGVM